jgi:hypothetical protein
MGLRKENTSLSELDFVIDYCFMIAYHFFNFKRKKEDCAAGGKELKKH